MSERGASSAPAKALDSDARKKIKKITTEAHTVLRCTYLHPCLRTCLHTCLRAGLRIRLNTCLHADLVGIEVDDELLLDVRLIHHLQAITMQAITI